MFQIRLPEKRDGGKNGAYTLAMERGTQDMKSYFDLMKQRNVVLCDLNTGKSGTPGERSTAEN